MLALALAAALSAQDPVEPFDVEAALRTLIERTNASKGFRARYELRKDGRSHGDMELVYEAPQRVRLTLELDAADGGPGRVRTWLVDGRLSVRIEDEERGDAAGDLDVAALFEEYAEATAMLAASFPLGRSSLGPGPVVAMQWGIDPQTDKADFDIQLAWESGERRALLGWLPRLGAGEALPRREGQRIVFEPDDRVRAELSTVSGFPEVLRLVGLEGVVVEVELLELELDPAPAPGVFDVPAPAAEASPLFDGMTSIAFGIPQELRQAAYARVASCVREQRVAWDDDARASWRAFLVGLHERSTPPRLEAWSAEARERMRGFGAWLSERLVEAPDDPTQRQRLEDAAEDWRVGLSAGLDRTFAAFLEALPRSEARAGEGELHAQLAAIEREVVGELLEREVRLPLLAEIDALVDAALGDG